MFSMVAYIVYDSGNVWIVIILEFRKYFFYYLIRCIIKLIDCVIHELMIVLILDYCICYILVVKGFLMFRQICITIHLVSFESYANVRVLFIDKFVFACSPVGEVRVVVVAWMNLAEV